MRLACYESYTNNAKLIAACYNEQIYLQYWREVLAFYDISFRGLNVNFRVDPVAFNVFGFDVMWYGVIISSAILCAIFYANRSSVFFDLDKEKLSDIILIAILSAFVGARLYYVVFYTGDIYKKNLIKIFFVHQGGLAIYGGIITAFVAVILSAKLKKMNIALVLDIFSVSLLLGQSIGRWGNFVNQEAFGCVTALPWGMKSNATFGQYVHPCFLYESLWCLMGFLILHIFSRKYKKRDGQVCSLYFVWYGIGRFFIEMLRSDSLYLPNTDLKVSQIMAFISLIIGTIAFYLLENKPCIAKFSCNYKKR